MKTAIKVDTTQKKLEKSTIKHLSNRYTDRVSLVKGVSINVLLFMQGMLIVAAYAVLAYMFSFFFYFSIAATFVATIYILFRFDGQIRISWLLLMSLSFGFGYILLIMSLKEINCFFTRGKYKKILLRLPMLDGTYVGVNEEKEDKARDYLTRENGFSAFKNTDLEYFSDAHTMFEDIFIEIEQAEKFIFIETFIICDGVLLDRLLKLLERKMSEGVEVYLIYDSAGCQRMLTGKMEKRLRESSINLREFKPMLGVFHMAQNFRDHRKIFVIDGKSAYIGGSNIDDECANLLGLDLRWRDNALKLKGDAVNAVSQMYIRQWELSGGDSLDYNKFAGTYSGVNDSCTVPYVSGVEMKNSVCHGLYLTMIESAKRYLYISSPYFVPDKKIYRAIKSAAKRGVDVRLVLPEVCDYAFIYRVTKSYAESLIESGVKVYYVEDSFMHSKTVLNDIGVSIGSANLDIRSFFEEYDNGVYTDDSEIEAEVLADYNEIFTQTNTATKQKQSLFLKLYTSLLKLFSPLM